MIEKSENHNGETKNPSTPVIDPSLIKTFIKIVNIQRKQGIRGDVPGIGLFGRGASYNGNLMLYKYLDSRSLKKIEKAKGYSTISDSSISIQDDIVSISLTGRYVHLDKNDNIVARIPSAEFIEICQQAKLKSAEEKLLRLCFFGNDINKVKQILTLSNINLNRQFETNIKDRTIFGDTYLILAAKMGHTQIVRSLLQYNADKTITNYFGQTAASVASTAKIRELINSYDATKEMPIVCETTSFQKVLQKPPVIPSIIQSTTDKSVIAGQKAYKPMTNKSEKTHKSEQVSHEEQKTYRSGEPSLFHKIVEKTSLLKPIVEMSSKEAEDKLVNLCFYGGDIERVKELLSIEAIDINRQFSLGNTCLIQAARKGHIKIVRLLLEKGANKDIPNFIDQTPTSVASSPEIKKLIDSWNVIKDPSTKINL